MHDSLCREREIPSSHAPLANNLLRDFAGLRVQRTACGLALDAKSPSAIMLAKGHE